MAILGLLTAAIPLLLWLFKRYGSRPALEEKHEALGRTFAQTLEEMAKFRQAGDDARADHLLRWLRLNGFPTADAERRLGQCSSGHSAGGDSSDPAENGGGAATGPAFHKRSEHSGE